MPAYAEEVECAEQEGVKFLFLAAPLEVVAKNNKVAGLKYGRMMLGDFDKSGRRRPKSSGGGDLVIEADQIIVAIGQYMDSEGLFDDVGIEMNSDGFIKTDALLGRTSVDWIFAGGDAVTGAASVVEAVGGGEKGAVGIDMMLNGENNAFWRDDKVVDTFFNPDDDPVEYKRADIRLRPVIKRKNNFSEVELPWTEGVAVAEAKRCLRCDFGKPAFKRSDRR